MTTQADVLAWLRAGGWTDCADAIEAGQQLEPGGGQYRCRLRAEHGLPQSPPPTEAQEEDPPLHMRAWDLLRQMRSELSDENLISQAEYAWLAAGSYDPKYAIPGNGSPAPRRLETYDEHEAQIAALRAQVQTLTEQNRKAAAPRPVACGALQMAREGFNACKLPKGHEGQHDWYRPIPPPPPTEAREEWQQAVDAYTDGRGTVGAIIKAGAALRAQVQALTSQNEQLWDRLRAYENHEALRTAPPPQEE